MPFFSCTLILCSLCRTNGNSSLSRSPFSSSSQIWQKAISWSRWPRPRARTRTTSLCGTRASWRASSKVGNMQDEKNVYVAQSIGRQEKTERESKATTRLGLCFLSPCRRPPRDRKASIPKNPANHKENTLRRAKEKRARLDERRKNRKKKHSTSFSSSALLPSQKQNAGTAATAGVLIAGLVAFRQVKMFR